MVGIQQWQEQWCSVKCHLHAVSCGPDLAFDMALLLLLLCSPHLLHLGSGATPGNAANMSQCFHPKGAAFTALIARVWVGGQSYANVRSQNALES